MCPASASPASSSRSGPATHAITCSPRGWQPSPRRTTCESSRSTASGSGELEEARRADLQNLGAQIAQRRLTIEANANEEGHLYGSVNADQIAAALKAEGFPIETENVHIEGPLKDLGLYTIKIHLAQEIYTEVKLWVIPTHTEDVTATS